MEDRENNAAKSDEMTEKTCESVCEDTDQTEAEATEAETDKKSLKEDRKKIKKLEAELAEANKKLEADKADMAALNDKYLRLMAEYDNFRRRSQKEREGVYSDAFSEAIAAILPVMDNVERAAKYNDAENVAKGIEMILKSFADTLAKLGVTEIETQGKTFDPKFHNAVMHIEDEAYGENEIVEVFQRGYIIGDKVVRHAMVKVAN